MKIHNKKVTARAAALRKYFWLGEEKLKTNLLPFVCASFASVAMRECDGFYLNSAAWICCAWLSRQPDKQHISREGGERVKWHSDHGCGLCKDRSPQQMIWLNWIFILTVIFTNSNIAEKKKKSVKISAHMRATSLFSTYSVFSPVRPYIFMVKNCLCNAIYFKHTEILNIIKQYYFWNLTAYWYFFKKQWLPFKLILPVIQSDGYIILYLRGVSNFKIVLEWGIKPQCAFQLNLL